MPGLAIVHTDAVMQIGWIDNVMIARFSKTPTLADATRFRDFLVELVARFPTGIGYIVLTPEAKGPEIDKATQELLKEFFLKLSEQLLAICIVIPTAGVVAASRRVLLSAMFMLLKKRETAHVCANAREAVSWTVKTLEGK